MATDPSTQDPAASTRDEILRATMACFERYGRRKTTMEDIARASGVSRKTVYRHFASKDELITAFSDQETLRVCTTTQAQLDLSLPPAELIADAEWRLLRAGWDGPRAHLNQEDELGYTMRIMEHSGRRAEIIAEYWAPVFDQLERAGVLRTDVSREEMTAWILLIHTALLTSTTAPAVPDEIHLRRLRLLLAPAVLKSG